MDRERLGPGYDDGGSAAWGLLIAIPLMLFCAHCWQDSWEPALWLLSGLGGMATWALRSWSWRLRR